MSSSNPSVQFTGAPGSGIAAVSATLADPSSFVYVDTNGNGRRDTGEVGIANVLISLSGLTNTGVAVHQEMRTDSDGYYQFAFLAPGDYSVHETQPAGYLDGAESIGSLGGTIVDDGFTNIVLRSGDIGINYNFGELPLPVSRPGDSNHDGRFDSADLLLVFQAGEYEDVTQHNSTFDEGDWDLDGDFTADDIILALLQGGYDD